MYSCVLVNLRGVDGWSGDVFGNSKETPDFLASSNVRDSRNTRLYTIINTDNIMLLMFTFATSIVIVIYIHIFKGYCICKNERLVYHAAVQRRVSTPNLSKLLQLMCLEYFFDKKKRRKKSRGLIR